MKKVLILSSSPVENANSGFFVQSVRQRRGGGWRPGGAYFSPGKRTSGSAMAARPV